MAAYPLHTNQLQHNVPQPTQQLIQPGHPGQPNPHAMQHLHPNAQAFAHQQNMQQLANNQAALQQQQQLMRQRAMMMNAAGMNAGANQGINPETRQMVTRGFLPNGMIAGAGGPPQHPAMAGFPGAGGPPHIRGPMIPAHLNNVNVNAAAAAAQMQQQQQHIAAQQLALANQGLNAQAANQAINMQQQVNAAQNPALAQQQMSIAAAQAAAARGQQQQKPLLGQSVLKLQHFLNTLGTYESERLRTAGPDHGIAIWRKLMGDFFSPTGSLRLNLYQAAKQESKQFDIQSYVLPRFFSTIMQNGIKSVQIVAELARERELPSNQGTLVESKCTMIYWLPNGGCCFHRGVLKAHYNSQLLIEVLDIAIQSHEEYIPRSQIQQSNSHLQDSPDSLKNSPRSKAKRAATFQPTIPDNKLTEWGVPHAVIRCLEVLETISIMRDLFIYQQNNPSLAPQAALAQLVKQWNQAHQMAQHPQHQQAQAQAIAAANAAAAQGMQNQQGHPGGPNVNGPGQIHPSPHMNLGGGMANSPSIQEARLVPPSPHIRGQTTSPAQNHLQAPGLAHNPSQQQHPTSNPNSQTPTTVGSAGTSPNQPQKRRRPSSSQVKNEVGEDGEANVKVKQSPRVGANKRVKPNPS